MSDVVITGAGVVSPYGVGGDRFRVGVLSGEACVAPIKSFDAGSFPATVAAEVPAARLDAAWLRPHLTDDEPTRSQLERWEHAGLLRDRRIGMAVLAATQAWTHAGCGEPERGATLCLALGLERALLDDLYRILDHGTLDWAGAGNRGLPRSRLRIAVDHPARAVRALLGLRGRVIVHTSACAAGAMSLLQASRLIRRGTAEIVLAGGADSMINPLGVGGMSRLGAPSPRASVDACRPFHRRRDGLAMGEGAAVFVVERRDRARARGAVPLALVLGGATTQDGHAATAPWPDGRGAARAMRDALLDADLAADAIDYVNAHGTGTPLNDPAEAAAIRAVFGARPASVPVSSVKGAIGHWMAASGSAEAAAVVAALSEQLIPPTAFLDDVDPACELDHVAIAPRKAAVQTALSNSVGFGGQNASLVLGAAS